MTVRRLLLVAVGVLYVLSIPWWREPGAEPRYVLGLPDWVAVALGCYAAAAVLNAWAWLRTDLDDPPRGSGTSGEEAGGP